MSKLTVEAACHTTVKFALAVSAFARVLAQDSCSSTQQHISNTRPRC